MIIKKSIIRNYLLLSLFAGICMGVIFPFFASLFTTYKSSLSQIIFVISCILAGIIVGLISFLIGRFTLIHSIKRLFRTFEHVAEGDLTVRCSLVSEDELGQLSNDFNDFLSKMEKIMKQNQHSIEIIKDLSTDLEETVLANELSSKEIAKGTATLAEDAALQNEELTNIQNRLLESSGSIDSGFLGAKEMLASSTKACELAQSGRSDMQDIISQFEWIRETIAFATSSIENLGKRSNEIASITDFITEIASQTNLLALNASIEAAHAGDSGKGFAVVAEEIGKLSAQTTDASSKIVSMIEAIRSETSNAILTMETNLTKVNVQLTSIDSSIQALDAIVTSIQNTKEGAKEVLDIYQAIQTMFYAVEANIQKIYHVIESDAAYSEEVAASTQDQYTTLTSLNVSAKKLLGIVDDLSEDFNHFKTS